MKQEIVSYFTTECPWRDTLYWYDTLDSTNTRAKQMAKEGAPHGTVIIATQQTGGRGRMGRSFSSPAGMGVYLSVVLRPNCTPDRLMHLTCAAGVAGRLAVEAASGVQADIKWPNDLVCGTKKLGGILTELGLDSATGLMDYAIVGIGVNCCQKNQDFPEALRKTATSIQQQTGTTCSPAKLSAALIQALYRMDKMLLSGKEQLMQDYRHYCITPGREIAVVQGDSVDHGTALDIDADGGLRVRLENGMVKTVSSGEVSIRGMYGYL